MPPVPSEPEVINPESHDQEEVMSSTTETEEVMSSDDEEGDGDARHVLDPREQLKLERQDPEVYLAHRSWSNQDKPGFALTFCCRGVVRNKT